jgi:hypothetical protein
MPKIESPKPTFRPPHAGDWDSPWGGRLACPDTTAKSVEINHQDSKNTKFDNEAFVFFEPSWFSRGFEFPEATCDCQWFCAR